MNTTTKKPMKVNHTKQFLELLFQIFALILLILVTASVPIIKKIYLFKLNASVDATVDTVSGNATFGVFGYCTSGVTNTAGIGPFSKTTTSSGDCSSVRVGWTFQNIPGFSSIESAISSSATGVLLLHPIAAAFTLLAVLFTIKVMFQKPTRPPADAEKYYVDPKWSRPRKASLFAMILVTATFAVDLIVVLMTKNTVHSKSDGAATLGLGSAVFLVLIAMLFLWVSFILGVMDVANVTNLSRDLPPESNQTNQQSGNNGTRTTRRRPQFCNRLCQCGPRKAKKGKAPAASGTTNAV